MNESVMMGVKTTEIFTSPKFESLSDEYGKELDHLNEILNQLEGVVFKLSGNNISPPLEEPLSDGTGVINVFKNYLSILKMNKGKLIDAMTILNELV